MTTVTKISQMTDADIDAKLEAIAVKRFNIETLETRNNDSDDFHDIAVWNMKAALAAAFQAGVDAATTPVSPVPFDTIQSKKSYATAPGARNACGRDDKEFAGTHELPSGRFVYLFNIYTS